MGIQPGLFFCIPLSLYAANFSVQVDSLSLPTTTRSWIKFASPRVTLFTKTHFVLKMRRPPGGRTMFLVAYDNSFNALSGAFSTLNPGLVVNASGFYLFDGKYSNVLLDKYQRRVIRADNGTLIYRRQWFDDQDFKVREDDVDILSLSIFSQLKPYIGLTPLSLEVANGVWKVPTYTIKIDGINRICGGFNYVAPRNVRKRCVLPLAMLYGLKFEFHGEWLAQIPDIGDDVLKQGEDLVVKGYYIHGFFRFGRFKKDVPFDLLSPEDCLEYVCSESSSSDEEMTSVDDDGDIAM